MSRAPELTPLQPREFFGSPWSGDGEWQPRAWLRWIIGRRRLRFRVFTTWLTDELWLVHDTTTWEDGRVEHQHFVATLVAPDRVRLTGAEIPGGCEVSLRSDGFSFSPYLVSVPVPFLPFPLLVRCHDACRLEGDELVDTIDISLMGIPVGRQVMRLRPERMEPSATSSGGELAAI